MININDVMETNAMIHEENLDVRTITMGISLLDCITDDLNKTCKKIYDKRQDIKEREWKRNKDMLIKEATRQLWFVLLQKKIWKRIIK